MHIRVDTLTRRIQRLRTDGRVDWRPLTMRFIWVPYALFLMRYFQRTRVHDIEHLLVHRCNMQSRNLSILCASILKLAVYLPRRTNADIEGQCQTCIKTVIFHIKILSCVHILVCGLGSFHG